jgi:hypothetical protein
MHRVCALCHHEWLEACTAEPPAGAPRIQYVTTNVYDDLVRRIESIERRLSNLEELHP